VLFSRLLPFGGPQVLLFVLGLWCLKVRECERFRCLHLDGGLLDWSQQECSSSTSSAVASWVVSRLKCGGRQCWGVSEDSDGIPEHKSTRIQNARTFKSRTQFTKEETKNLLKTARASKVVNPFTRALAPPFIGRRMDFYIPKIPSNLTNIPSVNMYMNVLYISWFAGLISYIYKSATSSHIKPGLLS
jgi:hypothetical protein